MTTAVIIGNPNSGSAGDERYLEGFADTLRAGGLAVEVLNTEHPDHATELAAAAGDRLVIAAGGALAVGVGYGAATSLINDVSSPYGTIGSRMADTGWQWAAEVVSHLLGVGWAWAGLALVVGWLAGAGARGGAAAAGLALLAATTAYYGTDSVLLGVGPEGRFVFFWPEMRFWWLASVIFGPALGAVGASIGRPGMLGLLAGLTLPAGATAQTIWLYEPMFATPAEDCARVIVWMAAAAVAGVVIARFSRTRS